MCVKFVVVESTLCPVICVELCWFGLAGLRRLEANAADYCVLY